MMRNREMKTDSVVTFPKVKVVVLVIIFMATNVQSLSLHLESGRAKCLSEELRYNSLTHGHYRIALDNPHSHRISVRVSDPNGDNIHHMENVESGQFAFTVSRTGYHTVCFWSTQFELSEKFPIDFDWKSGVAAKDWTEIAKKGKVDKVELELKKLEKVIESIHEEMIILRESEEEMRSLNQTTSTRMATLSVLSLFICLAVAGLQLWHLKSFFEKKKVL